MLHVSGTWWSCLLVALIRGISLAFCHIALHKSGLFFHRLSKEGSVTSVKQANVVFYPKAENWMYYFVLLLGHKKINFVSATKLLTEVLSSMASWEPWGWANLPLCRDISCIFYLHACIQKVPTPLFPCISCAKPYPGDIMWLPRERWDKVVLSTPGFPSCSHLHAWEASC